MRLRRVILGLAGLFLTLLAAIWVMLKYSPEVTISFTEAELQAEIEPKFPARRCLLNSCVELLNPRLSLIEGTDRLGIEASFVATLGARKMPGTAKFSGRPHYDRSSGNFFLQDVNVTEFAMRGNAPDFDEVVRVRGPGIVAAIVNRFPLYSVQSHPRYGSIAKLALKSVAVANGKLQVVFSNPLLAFGKS